MASGDSSDEQDPDDWFAEPKPAPPSRARPPGPGSPEHGPPRFRGRRSNVDDRLRDGDTGRTRLLRPALSPFSATMRAAVAAGVLALILVLIGLAAAGVFSGKSRPRAPTASSLPARTTPMPSTGPEAIPAQGPTTTLKPGD